MWFGCDRKKQSETAVNLQDCRFSFLQQGKFGSSSTGPVSAGQGRRRLWEKSYIKMYACLKNEMEKKKKREKAPQNLGLQFSSPDSLLEFVGLSTWNHRLPRLCHRQGYLLAMPVSIVARISKGPIIPNDEYKRLPVKTVRATGAQYWTKSQFTLSHTRLEELSFRKLHPNIWGLALSWDKHQGINSGLNRLQ